MVNLIPPMGSLLTKGRQAQQLEFSYPNPAILDHGNVSGIHSAE